MSSRNCKTYLAALYAGVASTALMIAAGPALAGGVNVTVGGHTIVSVGGGGGLGGLGGGLGGAVISLSGDRSVLCEGVEALSEALQRERDADRRLCSVREHDCRRRPVRSQL